MAEIGVVQFARIAREVAEAAVPRYRSPFSQHTLAQPTLLAIEVSDALRRLDQS
jgi:hypothetical protein